MRIWFTSDTHFDHSSIIKYSNRPFKNVETMNKALIRNWNERVKPDDLVFFLGDFCFKSDSHKAAYWKQQLNGDIVFVRGNHDKNNTVKTPIEGILITVAKKKIWLVHNPDHYNPKYKINFVGHVHDKWLIKRKRRTILINVGVDVWNYKPVGWDDIVHGVMKQTRINLNKY